MRYVRAEHLEKGMIFAGYIGVVMQNNYLFMEKMPKAKEVSKTLKNVIPYLDNIYNAVADLKPLKKADKTLFAAFMSSVVNSGFNKFMVKKQQFKADKDCIACKKCVSVCPTNNIEMVKGVPTFKENCCGCLACLHHCPTQAINVKNETQDKGRYLCPEYTHWKNKNF